MILIHHNFPMFVFVMLYFTHLIGTVLLMYALYTLLHTIRYAFVNALTFPEVRISAYVILPGITPFLSIQVVNRTHINKKCDI